MYDRRPGRRISNYDVTSDFSAVRRSTPLRNFSGAGTDADEAFAEPRVVRQSLRHERKNILKGGADAATAVPSAARTGMGKNYPSSLPSLEGRTVAATFIPCGAATIVVVMGAGAIAAFLIFFIRWHRKFSSPRKDRFLKNWRDPRFRLVVACATLLLTILSVRWDPTTMSSKWIIMSPAALAIRFLFTDYRRFFPGLRWTKIIMATCGCLCNIYFSTQVVHHWFLRDVCGASWLVDHSMIINLLLFLPLLSVWASGFNWIVRYWGEVPLSSALPLTYGNFNQANAILSGVASITSVLEIAEFVNTSLTDKVSAELVEKSKRTRRVKVTLVISGRMHSFRPEREFNDSILFSATELSRSFICGLVGGLKVAAMTQDWDFPHFQNPCAVPMPFMRSTPLKWLGRQVRPKRRQTEPATRAIRHRRSSVSDIRKASGAETMRSGVRVRPGEESRKGLARSTARNTACNSSRRRSSLLITPKEDQLKDIQLNLPSSSPPARVSFSSFVPMDRRRFSYSSSDPEYLHFHSSAPQRPSLYIKDEAAPHEVAAVLRNTPELQNLPASRNKLILGKRRTVFLRLQSGDNLEAPAKDVFGYEEWLFSGKVMRYGSMVVAVVSDSCRLWQIVFYHPDFYSQYIHPRTGAICAVTDVAIANSGNKFIGYDPSRTTDMCLRNGYVGYSYFLCFCVALTPVLCGFAVFFELLRKYRRHPEVYCYRAKKRARARFSQLRTALHFMKLTKKRDTTEEKGPMLLHSSPSSTDDEGGEVVCLQGDYGSSSSDTDD